MIIGRLFLVPRLRSIAKSEKGKSDRVAYRGEGDKADTPPEHPTDLP